MRETEITDSLVELFTQLVQKINTRAEKRVEGEFDKELKRVRGKEGILLRLAEAAVAEPGGTVRKVIYPVAGESTLKALAAEAAANEARYRARVRTVLRSSYSNHWRRMQGRHPEDLHPGRRWRAAGSQAILNQPRTVFRAPRSCRVLRGCAGSDG
ncbi:hypothetical protein ACFXKG_10325 [Streptomyces sp. NPDC059255]|uniref:hypothetical protein n=1 Tax=Streptomyces sp. NPDC059255 TaxID=3346793 RepID=UPI003674309D